MNNNLKKLIILFFLGMLLQPYETAFGLTTQDSLLRQLIPPAFGHQMVLTTEHHLFSNPFKNPFSGEGLHLSRENFRTRLTKHLYSEGLPASYSLSELELNDPSPTEGVVIRRFGFRYADHPLCRFEIKTWSFENGQLPRISGHFPGTEPAGTVTQGLWYEKEDAFSVIQSLPEFSDKPLKSLRSKKCLYDTDTGWVPAWEILFSFNGLYYLSYGDHLSVFSTEKKFFTADATLQFYRQNPTDASLETDTFSLTGDGYLTTDEITTKVQEKSGRAFSSSLDFVKSPTDEDFAEINTFAHILKIQQWFKDLGFVWTKDEILTLRIHHNSLDNIRYNNGLYLPPEYKGDDAPSITLGDGDGAVLQNLALDRDVASHEFGHHVIYRTLKSTLHEEVKGEPVGVNTNHSGAIHEALADYYIFAMTEDKNACLGESICPGGTHDICYQVGKCLRTAIHQLTYDSEAYWDFGRLFHLKSQIVSGMLWDIRQDAETDARLFDQLVLKSVPFLKTSSNYRDLLIALFSSDKQFYDSKFGCMIESYAKSRGFSDLLTDVVTNCGVSSSPDIEKREQKKCGTLGSAQGNSSSTRMKLWMMLLFLFPAIFSLRMPHRTK